MKCPLCPIESDDKDIKICPAHQLELMDSVVDYPMDVEVELVKLYCNN